MQGNLHVRFGGGRMEKGRSRLTVTAAANGHTNSGVRRSLASRPPYNRKSQAKFLCVRCGHAANADVNAARNIRALAVSGNAAIELAGSRA